MADVTGSRTGEVLRGLARPVYLPIVASGLGTGMLVPVLPLYLRDTGLSFGVVSTVLAAAGVGAMVGGVPAGGALARAPEKVVMAAALTLMAVTAALLGATTAVVALVAFRVAYGIGQIGLRLSRQTLVTRRVDPRLRGRSMAFFGGSMRLAFFIGPLLGGVAVELTGFRTTFAISGSVIALGLWAALGRSESTGADRHPVPEPAPPGLMASLWSQRRNLVVGGIGPALVMTVREGRYVVVPLIADEIGLGPAAVGAVVAVGTGADLALFPLSGFLMDRFGRLYAMVPAFSLVALGLLLLSVADGAGLVVLAGVVIGIGNGMSAGTLLTLGSDLAPRDHPGPFLSGLATLQDSGKVIGPLLVGLTADAVGLDGAAVALAVVMFVAVVWLVVVVGETSGRPRFATA